jgi:hypothetical protein
MNNAMDENQYQLFFHDDSDGENRGRSAAHRQEGMDGEGLCAATIFTLKLLYKNTVNYHGDVPYALIIIDRKHQIPTSTMEALRQLLSNWVSASRSACAGGTG